MRQIEPIAVAMVNRESQPRLSEVAIALCTLEVKKYLSINRFQHLIKFITSN